MVVTRQGYFMASPEPSINDRVFINRTVEAVIRIGVIAGLIGWCFMIARPFLVPIIWGAIIAVTVFHGYAMLEVALGGRRILAAVLVTVFMLVKLMVPSVLLGDSQLHSPSSRTRGKRETCAGKANQEDKCPAQNGAPTEAEPFEATHRIRQRLKSPVPIYGASQGEQRNASALAA